MDVAVVVFPGSNCDRDALHAIDDALGLGSATAVHHEERDLVGFDAVVLPGGFSWGDYLRCGAMARFAPIMSEVRRVAAQGLPVLGICNGFQVLCESGLLPGALLRNDHLHFRCDIVDTTIDQADTPWTCAWADGDSARLPIAHGEGRYHADPDQLAALVRDRRIVVRYAGANPNGSALDIAGICSAERNVVGMMPHPERAVHDWMGSSDGVLAFESLRRHVEQSTLQRHAPEG
ncbi:MAG: phosphoribosylformylglycinamidine synthase subunit PurQ, partial [Thermoleophilia bacterium]|nr:phosphoribosylformylglycinamidine synthase subunit PurQ [Thermoleophilia bacterium]